MTRCPFFHVKTFSPKNVEVPPFWNPGYTTGNTCAVKAIEAVIEKWDNFIHWNIDCTQNGLLPNGTQVPLVKIFTQEKKLFLLSFILFTKLTGSYNARDANKVDAFANFAIKHQIRRFHFSSFVQNIGNNQSKQANYSVYSWIQNIHE